MKIYISIPITGMVDMNRPLADEIAEYIRAAGHEPLIPHDIEAADHEGPCPGSVSGAYNGVTGNTHTGYCYLKQDIIEMLGCDAVVAAPGWRDSKGARAEIRTAEEVAIAVFEWSDFDGIRAVDAGPIFGGAREFATTL